MALLSTYTAVVSAISFIILWLGIHFLVKWIPPSDDIPAWKSGVMAAVITVFSTLFLTFLLSLTTIGG